jgi:hypothetical protein
VLTSGKFYESELVVKTHNGNIQIVDEEDNHKESMPSQSKDQGNAVCIQTENSAISTNNKKSKVKQDVLNMMNTFGRTFRNGHEDESAEGNNSNGSQMKSMHLSQSALKKSSNSRKMSSVNF